MKIHIVCRGNDYFLSSLIRHWRNCGHEFVSNMYDADIVWCEWANEASIIPTRDSPRKNVIVRMHGSEYFQSFWKYWGDKVAFVVQNNPAYRIPDIESVHLPPPIDIDFWCSTNLSKTNTIAMIGNYGFKKNHLGLLRLLLDKQNYFDEILFVGNEVVDGTLKIESHTTIQIIKEYANRHTLPVNIAGSKTPEQLRNIYNTVQFVVSMSISEGCHQVIEEAMCCGCKALVQDWMGSEYNYPHEVIFDSPLSFWRKIADYKFCFSDLQNYAKNHFSQQIVFEKIDSLFKEIIR